MAKVPDILYQGQPAATDTALYTVPASTKTTITSIIATNTNSATKYFTIHLVQNGGSIANNTALMYQQKLNGTGDVGGAGLFAFEVPIILLTTGDKLSGIQETATAITITIMGYTEAI